MSYIDAMVALTDVDRIKALAKGEKIERQILKMDEKKSFFEYVGFVDQNYKDTVFWLTENTKNETLETIQKWTLGWRIEMQQRILKRLQNESERSNRRSE